MNEKPLMYQDHYLRPLDAAISKGGNIVGELKNFQCLSSSKAKGMLRSLARDSMRELSGDFEVLVKAQENEDVISIQRFAGVVLGHRVDKEGYLSFTFEERWVQNLISAKTGRRRIQKESPWQKVE